MIFSLVSEKYHTSQWCFQGIEGRGPLAVQSRGSGHGGVAGTPGACSKAAFVAQADSFNVLQINVNNKYLKVFLFMLSPRLRKPCSISMCYFNLGVLGKLMEIMKVLTPKILTVINTSLVISLTLRNCV